MTGSTIKTSDYPREKSLGIKPTQQVSKSTTAEGVGFVITLLYIIFDYARPQDTIPIISVLRPSMILTLLLVVLLFMNYRQLYMAASPQISRMLMLLLLCAIHVPFAVNNGRAFIITQNLMLTLITCISIIFFVNTPDRLRIFLRYWIYLMIYLAVNGILGGGRAGSSFLLDENDFALLMNVMLPFSIFLFMYEGRKKIKLLYLIASFLCILSIVISFSRGGFVGLMMTALVIWLTSPRKVLSIILVGFLALGVYQFTNQSYWDEMATIGTAQDYNAVSRFEFWKAAWEMFIDHPLGVGPANYSVLLPEYQSDYFGDRNMWGKAAHSLWFTLLPELGILGVFLYLSLLRANIRDIWNLKSLPKDQDNQRLAYILSLAFTASLAGYFTSGTFLSVLYYPHYWYLTAMIVATRKIVVSSKNFH